MKTEQLSNYQLVTVAVMLIAGNLDYVDTEDIAIKVNEMVPERFGWRKYPDRIDLDSVRVALRDAKKPKNGSLLIGSNTDGWMLSPVGMKWVEALDLEYLKSQQAIQHRRDSITANLESERMRLRQSQAYRLFGEGRKEAITTQDFFQFARINEYFGEKARQRRYVIVSNAVADDELLSTLWAMLQVHFRKEMLSNADS